MLTFISTAIVLFFVIRWHLRKRTAQHIQNNKPSWAIGYALYFLNDQISSTSDPDEALRIIGAAHRRGLPNLHHINSLSDLVGLKAYAKMQGDAGTINNTLAISSLSQAVAIESHTATRMAVSNININLFMTSCDPKISESDLRKSAIEILAVLSAPNLTKSGRHLLHTLIIFYLERSFERKHGEPFLEYRNRMLRNYSDA